MESANYKQIAAELQMVIVHGSVDRYGERIYWITVHGSVDRYGELIDWIVLASSWRKAYDSKEIKRNNVEQN